MDNLDRLRKVLDFEGSLRHDPTDRYEGYYPTVVRRLSGRDLVIDEALPAASRVRTEPMATIDIGPAASLVAEEPLASEPPVMKKGRGRKAKVVDVIPTPVVVEPEPTEPSPVEEVTPASADVGFEDEVEFVPFTKDGVTRAVEPEMLEFQELWVEPGQGGSALEPELVPPTSAAGDDGQAVAPSLVEPGSEAVVVPADETVTAEAELTPSDDPLTVDGYTLYAKRATLRGGERTIHFFAREPAEGAVPATLPEGFEVERNPRSRLPYLRRIRTKAARSSKGRKSVRTSKKRSKRNP